jgi:hypothetical protein
MERLLPISLLLDGRPIASDTTAFSAGARVIVLRTAGADGELLLYSTYTGGDELEVAIVSELIEVGSCPTELVSRELAVGEGAFTYSRSFALYDHLQRLQALCARRLGAELRYELAEAAVRSLDPAAVVSFEFRSRPWRSRVATRLPFSVTRFERWARIPL